METTAKLKGVRVSPQKARLVADQIRGMSVEKAMELLEFSDKKSATILRKLLSSALANAEHNDGADIDELKVDTIYVGQGPKYRRVRARAKGRANHINKPTSHITLTVSDQ